MSFSFNKNNFIPMGVINITPNSFSDSSSQTKEEYQKLLASIVDRNIILDLGAESTAPMNASITANEEWSRVENFLKVHWDLIKRSHELSLDTYKESTFLKFYEYVKDKNYQKKIFWNDISGKLSSHLSDLFKDKNFNYIYSHNFSDTRENSGAHHQFVKKIAQSQLEDEIIIHFNQFAQRYRKFDHQFWFDPCFGFAKNRQQNQLLIKNIENWLEKIEHKNFLIGISRKSFLRFPIDANIKESETQTNTELQQQLIFSKILSKTENKNFIFRVHRPESIFQLDFYLKNFY